MQEPFDLLDRNAIVIKPKQPFIDWHNSCYPDSPLSEMDDHNMYLADLGDDSGDLEPWIKKHFDKFFVNELNDWVTDPSLWPRKRTFAMFKEWFDYEYFSVVLDTEKYDIEKF